MKRQITWLAIVVLVVAASLAATGAASAAGTTQVDGIQTLVSLGVLDDPADDLYWMDGYGGGRPALIGYWQTKTFVFGSSRRRAWSPRRAPRSSTGASTRTATGAAGRRSRAGLSGSASSSPASTTW